MLDNLLTSYPFGKLNDKQKNSLGFLIEKLKASSIQALRQQAYVLATIKHETAGTYRPIKELGSPQYLKSKPYYPFIGRGYIQLTWEANYKKFSELLHIDLLTIPDLAQRPEIAWKIAELGMVRGLFTGKKLSDYFNEKTDWINARKIINGLDKAEMIANYARKIYHVISLIEDIPDARGIDNPQEGDKGIPSP